MSFSTPLEHASPILAAGAICWRIVDGKVRILLVHRNARADVSLPKGKLDPGETLPQTAVREIAEETGLTTSLGAPLGTIEYTLPSGRTKTVHYWAAEVSEHALQLARFTSNEEISALEWTSLGKARKKLSYQHDAEVVDRFAARVAAGTARTFAIIALRHGKAVAPDSWDGPDAARPLLQRGHDQALSISTAIAAFAPQKIISSTAARCLATVSPLSVLTTLVVKPAAELSQDAHEYGNSDVSDVSAMVAKRLAKKRTSVLCSHGPVIPDIISEVARLTNTPVDSTIRSASALMPGEYTVLHVNRDAAAAGIVAIETHGPASVEPLTGTEPVGTARLAPSNHSI
jgi:8-oxo-dGTP pyrophosphatase MutT (NUDIX family)/phosphohistidine phosphatase SixA